MKKTLIIVAVILGIVGTGVLMGGKYALTTVHDQLVAQKIKFPPKEALEKDNVALVKYASAEVDTGEEAKAFSEYIGGHLKKVANGQTYSEVSSAYQKDKTNKTLEGQRMSLFMGESLRGILLSAWGWSLIGTLAYYAGLTMITIAIVLLVIALNNPNTKKKTTKKNKKKK